MKNQDILDQLYQIPKDERLEILAAFCPSCGTAVGDCCNCDEEYFDYISKL